MPNIIAASKGSQMIGLMIRKNITFREKGLIVYCIHAWRPYCRKVI